MRAGVACSPTYAARRPTRRPGPSGAVITKPGGVRLVYSMGLRTDNWLAS